ncbi:Uu.00g013830.m01.CDS01 [Anthostomella pinea]|uniref:Uu.00g013830.m01.CDS01 n=1 Tax=Anthostomella pinea TaxID=933095 RepID=A0AAI8YQ73_9PEZI|nr:Uu.00g013830.m01.CDS01 [Anthostomella pinea]
MSTTDNNSSSKASPMSDTLVIVLSTVFSVIGVVLIVVAAYLCVRRRHRRISLFNRGITPIGDEEIETWKRPNRRTSTKEKRQSGLDPADIFTRRPMHTPNISTLSLKRAPSVIQYQHNGAGRISLEAALATSPRSFINSSGRKYSMDLPRPEPAVLALAPNARSGLTDETVPGDDPFVVQPSPKRHPSRLYKSPPNSSPNARTHSRTWGSRSSSMRSYTEAWQQQGGGVEASPTGSCPHSNGHSRIYSSSSIPPRLSSGDDEALMGLSPPPSRRNNEVIGQALG